MPLRSLTSNLKAGFNKWRLAFLIFATIYAVFLTIDLGGMTLQWDEATHLNGGLLLLHGNFNQYTQSNMFYPPFVDVVIAAYFRIAGASLFTARLVPLTFAVLSVWVVFEFSYRTYGPKTALLASILLSVMPGFVWLARLTLLETALVFFFSASLMLFYAWLHKQDSKLLVLSGVALGLGFLVKYQILVAVIVMLASIFLLFRGYLIAKLYRFLLMILTAALIVLPWIIISYQVYSSGMLNQWIYALEIGNPQKALYSARFGPFSLPLFYLIEMTWPYGVVHPISIFIYIFGLLGLSLFLWRRKPADKFLLVWFFVVYVFFSFLGNRQWRYVMPIFPVLAVSAASLITLAGAKAEKAWKNANVHLNKKRAAQLGAACLIGVVAFSVAYSCADAYNWVAKDYAFKVPTEEATGYVGARLKPNESLLILCALNVFSQDIVQFYLNANGTKPNSLLQYPEYPVDTYTIDFNVTALVDLSSERHVKYLLLFEYGGTYPYFNSNLTEQAVYNILITSQRFSFETAVGEYPTRIFILTFH